MTGTAGDKNTPALIAVFGTNAETDECAGYVFPAIPHSTNGVGGARSLLQGWKEDHFANRGAARQQHHQAVYTKANT